ncbi:MAG: guanine deaminase [Woeseiaceae bacterium]|nr:guanine deaminase [Woeseiaceae bacterium]
MTPPAATGAGRVAAFRGSVLHCLDDPAAAGDAAIEYLDDGLLVCEDGHVTGLGPAPELLARLPGGAQVTDHRGKLIVPGLVDCHVHFPQVDMIASYGEQLLEWLEKYAFPAERRFDDPAHAADTAAFFVDELLRNGTTTALVFATVHPASVDAIFSAAERRGMRLVAGKVLMDHACPEDLRDGADAGIGESRELLRRWHGRGRLGYAVTPRFAVTSSERQLQAAGQLAQEFPDVHVHTHLAENRAEVERIGERFPECRSYLDVYERFGLLRRKSVFAHCLHIDDKDRAALARHGGAIAFCPSSNLFLGSGLFDLAAAEAHGVRVGAGSDVGGGTSLNMLATLADGYKVLQLHGQPLSAWRALYLATLGAARALYLDDRIGNFESGREADFVVLDPAATPLLARRTARAADIAERLFALLMLADDRAVAATYLMARPASVRTAAAGAPAAGR